MKKFYRVSCRSIELSFLQVDQALKSAGRSSLIKLSVGILSYTEGTSPKWCCQWSLACKSHYGWFLNIMNKFVLYQASSYVFFFLGFVWKRSQCASDKHSVELWFKWFLSHFQSFLTMPHRRSHLLCPT